MRYPFQQLKTTNAPLADELKAAAARVIDSGWYLRGNETETFEQQLAGIIGTEHAVGTATGLDAIRLIFRALIETGKLHEGDEVIVPANTFIASVLPLTELCLKPVLVDVDERTMNLDFSTLSRHITNRTRVVLPVHLYGTPTWDDTVARQLNDAGILIVEDNAQAIGATLSDGRKTGSLGIASAISFYPGKNIGALGDAGAVCTSDSDLAECVRWLGNYGGGERYKYRYRGYNSRIDEIQAAMLAVKLKHLDEVTAGRRRAAEAYNKSISNPLIIKPQILDNVTQVWHQYVIRTAERDRLRDYLASEGVGTMIHYPIPIHRQECYNGMFDNVQLPTTQHLSDTILSIPIADVSVDDARDIATIINRYK